MKSERVSIGGILLLALILRIIVVTSRSIQYDDAFSILLAQRSIPEIIHGTAADTMPPLFYFILHFWQAVSTQIGWLRVLTILCNLGSIFFLYLILRNIAGQIEALWGAGVAAISPLQIYHAQDVRMYALLALFQSAYLFCFLKIIHTSRHHKGYRAYYLGLVLSGAGSMYTHNLAIFGLVIPGIYLLIKREWKKLFEWGLGLGVIMILSLPWVIRVPGQIHKIQTAFWTPRPGIAEIINAILQFHVALPLPQLWLMVGLILSLLGVVLIVFENIRSGESKTSILFLASAILTPPVLLFIASYLMRPVFVPRGFLISGLLYAGLAGVTIKRALGKPGALLLMLVFMASAVISLPFFYTYEEFPRSPFREAAAYLESNREPNSIVIHDNKLSFFPVQYYSNGLDQQFLADEPGSHNDTLAHETQVALNLFPVQELDPVISGHREVYYLVFEQAIREYEGAGYDSHPVISWMAERMELADEHRFNDLIVYKFLN